MVLLSYPPLLTPSAENIQFKPCDPSVSPVNTDSVLRSPLYLYFLTTHERFETGVRNHFAARGGPTYLRKRKGVRNHFAARGGRSVLCLRPPRRSTNLSHSPNDTD
jgi:hypothetical protein